MNVLGIRFCRVARPDEAGALAATLRALGLPERALETPAGTGANANTFTGAVFPAGGRDSTSWVEIWPAGGPMPEMVMLQIVVDDADAFAEHARANGLDPKGPDVAHGERIYYLQGPGGLPISFQSSVAEDAGVTAGG